LIEKVPVLRLKTCALKLGELELDDIIVSHKGIIISFQASAMKLLTENWIG
jgi:hypothetical protein